MRGALNEEVSAMIAEMRLGYHSGIPHRAACTGAALTARIGDGSFGLKP
jgi:hypothetical protein